MIWLWVIFISISWTLSCIAWYVNIRWLHLTPFFEHKHEVKFFSSATVLQMKCFSPWCSKSCICCSDAPAQAVLRGLWEHILSNTVQCSKCIDIWMCWRTPPRRQLEGGVQDRHDTWQKILYSQAVAKGNFVRLFWLPNPTYVAPSVHVTTPPCCVSFSRHRHVSYLVALRPASWFNRVNMYSSKHQFLVIFMDFSIIPPK